MKKESIVFFTCLIIAVITATSVHYSKSISERNLSNLLLNDVEALSDDETTPSQEGGLVYLHHFSCKPKVETNAQVRILAIIKVNAHIGATVDLSDATQYFNSNPQNGEGPCKEGAQVTCNDYLRSIKFSN